MQATAALLREPGQPLSVEEVEVADPGEGEVRVALRGTGVCHTDLGVAAGGLEVPLPLVLGHEGSGVVESVGAGVTSLSEGDHVVLSFASCGQCPNCADGHPAYCLQFLPLNFGGARLDGSTALSQDGKPVYAHFFGQSSFATHAIATERNTVKVPQDAPLELLGPLGCGIQTGAGTVLGALDAQAGQSLAVFAVGGVGLSAVMAAKVAGCDPIIAVDLNAERLALAQELGATMTINGGETDPVEAIKEATGGLGVALAVEAVGIPPVIRQAVESLAPRGVCATVGFQGLENDVTFNQGPLLSVGQSIVGVIEGDVDPQEFIPHMLDLWRDGRFPFERLIERFSLEQINEAIASTHEGKAIKPVLVMD